MNRGCRFGLLLLLAASASAAQELYRWVDEEGNVHFSDRPPAEAAADVSELTIDADISPERQAEAEARLKANQELLENTRNSNAEAAQSRQEERTKSRQADRQRQTRCELARFNLRTLQEVGPVYSVNEAGERVYVEDDDRANKINQARRLVQQACG
ncbi:MAG: DUF4124 domain-containing protein [Xanthomonadales bacterium]|nr:DUF4124 domain-containing protein [Xanthomonadales bacterium]